MPNKPKEPTTVLLNDTKSLFKVNLMNSLNLNTLKLKSSQIMDRSETTFKSLMSEFEESLRKREEFRQFKNQEEQKEENAVNENATENVTGGEVMNNEEDSDNSDMDRNILNEN